MSQPELRQRKGKTEDEDVPAEKEVVRTPMEIAQEKYRKFFTRSFYGGLMIGVFAFILYTDHILVSLFVVLLQAIVFKELIALRYIEAKEKNLPGFRTLHWYLLGITFFFMYGAPVLQQLQSVVPFSTLEILTRYHLAVSFVLYVAGFIAFIVTLKKGLYKYQFGQITWTLFTLLLVVGQSAVIIQNIFRGLVWFLLPCSLIICNDIMAYMCGLVAGRKFIQKPLTSLSPNKTWEGFIGAGIFTLIFAFVFSGILAQYNWFICPYKPELLKGAQCTVDPIFIATVYNIPSLFAPLLKVFNLPQTVTLIPIQLHSIVFALFASLIAPFGGFFASGIKRAYRIKDFDSLFPGHGGMTDRMDCQLIMGLFTFVYLHTFIAPASMDLHQVLYHVSQLSAHDQQIVLQTVKAALSS